MKGITGVNNNHHHDKLVNKHTLTIMVMEETQISIC